MATARPTPNPPPARVAPVPLHRAAPLILADTSPRPITDPAGGPPRFTADTPYGPMTFPGPLPPVGATFTHESQHYIIRSHAPEPRP